MRGKVPKKQKKFKRQKEYHSSSEDGDENGPVEFNPVNLGSSDQDDAPLSTSKDVGKALPSRAGDEENKNKDAVSTDGSSGSDSEDSGETSNSGADESISHASTNPNRPAKKPLKRNDPDAFATSMSRILCSKLTTSQRSDPLLARSTNAAQTLSEINSQKLDQKAQRALVAAKRAAKEKGRIKDVLGLEDESVSTEAIVAEEKRLRRTAQKGVITLFNAFRNAQVKAEQTEQQAKRGSAMGAQKRVQETQDMSKQAFVDMIARGGK